MLMNSSLTYATRLYASLGADIWPIKLSRPLRQIASDSNTLAGSRVRTECKEAVKRLSMLSQVKWLQEVERMNLLPSDQMLIYVDKKFGWSHGQYAHPGITVWPKTKENDKLGKGLFFSRTKTQTRRFVWENLKNVFGYLYSVGIKWYCIFGM